MKKILIFILLTMLIMGLVACSSTPSSSTIENEITSNVTSGGDYAEILDFEKLNGREAGQNQYVAEVSFSIKFKKDFADVAKGLKTEASANGGPMAIMQVGLAIQSMQMTFGNFKTGDVFPLKREYPFVKTEQGWKIQG